MTARNESQDGTIWAEPTGTVFPASRQKCPACGSKLEASKAGVGLKDEWEYKYCVQKGCPESVGKLNVERRPKVGRWR